MGVAPSSLSALTCSHSLLHSRLTIIRWSRKSRPDARKGAIDREQSHMPKFGSFDVDAPKCRIRFAFVDTDCGKKLFSRMSATTSSKMLSWAAPYSWSLTEIALYCLDCDLFEACLIWTLDSLSVEMWSILLTITGQMSLLTAVKATSGFSSLLTIQSIIPTLSDVCMQLFSKLGDCIEVHRLRHGRRHWSCTQSWHGLDVWHRHGIQKKHF